MSQQADYIAIDGGGTRCRLVIESAGQRNSVEVGSSNVSTDIEGATAEIRDGLEQLAGRVGAPLESLLGVPAYAGLAGMTGAEMAAAVAARLPLRHLRIEDDRRAAVRGALESADGAVAHCGTGSFVATQQALEIRLCGGWGAVLGDQASAMWIGREALSATLDVVDGIADASPLTRDFLQRFDSAAGIVAFAAQASPAAFGELAPLVTAAAADADAMAVALLRRGADYLERSLRALGWQAPMPLVLTGGLAAIYGDYLAPALRRVLVPASGLPIDGALSLARDFALELNA